MARNALLGLGMVAPDDEWRLTRAVNALGFGPMTQATQAGRPNALLSAGVPAARPNDYLAPVAEMISPTLGGYGAGQLIGEGSRAIGQGDYLSGGAGLALGMAGLAPGYRAAPTRQLDNLGFYSQALEAAKAWPQTKGTPEQALMWLKKSGVKEGEIEATGLAKWLADTDMSDTVTMYHGTTEEGARGIKADGKVNGPAFFSDRKANAEDYGPYEVIPVPIRKRDLMIDPDLGGAPLLTVNEANGYYGNDGWTIDDYLNASRYSFGTGDDAPIAGPKRAAVTRDEIISHLEKNRVGLLGTGINAYAAMSGMPKK